MDNETIMQHVRNWVDTTSGGWFRESNVYSTLRQSIHDLKGGTIRQYLRRLKLDGIVEAHSSTEGMYRKIESNAAVMNLADLDGVDIKTRKVDILLPLDLHNVFNLYSKNIMVLAGDPNAGKSGWAFDIVRRNQWRKELCDLAPIHLFTSEMGEEELALRLSSAEPDGLFHHEHWNFVPISRSSNFADVVKPDKVNIIDYLEIEDNFFLMNQKFKQIHDKLTTGIAIINIQKSPKGASQISDNKGLYSKLGRGGSMGLEKPKVYISIWKEFVTEYGRTHPVNKAQIIKAKNWPGDISPDGNEYEWKLINGCRVESTAVNNEPF